MTACGTASPPAATSSGAGSAAVKSVAEIQAGAEFNDTDVMFLQMMVHHQKQGLEMTATAAERAKSPELKVLAEAVQATEKDELAMMQSWLKQWNKPVDVDTNTSLHADHGGLPGTGAAEIKALRTVKATQFDSAFLNLFLAHQHNAVEMAQQEVGKGANQAAKDFATRVRDSRQGEIQQMLKLMNG
ncbi:DUF305 domain-containing protein [Paractinoplanes rishiriensis]|uniref:DUF305 domain-containing protein n=1 Tax=Paractinoplanes rishiriensis TaxID=1050105 RepID=UPI0019406F06|nr:DUF305 domain-containing protein [Actinoplanes rishiriensis]